MPKSEASPPPRKPEGGGKRGPPATIASGANSDRLKRAVKDGDTIGIGFDGSQSIRFLGIDTPEKSYKAPFRLNSKGEPLFVQIESHADEWDAYLITPRTGGSCRWSTWPCSSRRNTVGVTRPRRSSTGRSLARQTQGLRACRFDIPALASRLRARAVAAVRSHDRCPRARRGF
jgi:hypothetical protein